MLHSDKGAQGQSTDQGSAQHVGTGMLSCTNVVTLGPAFRHCGLYAHKPSMYAHVSITDLLHAHFWVDLELAPGCDKVVYHQ